MATYVLVHGAWGGGWVYRPICDALREAGHTVFVAGLTGLGERAHLLTPAIDLSTHIRDVVATIDTEALDDIILCGHSYGGMVITGVATERAERIRGLVYIDAFLPGDGQALWDIADDASRAFYIDAQREAPGLVAPPVPRGEGPRQLARHPLLTLLEPVRVSAEAAAIRNRTYIYATRDAPTVFTQFHARVRADPAWKVHEIATGHVVMADDHDGLLALLLAEAER